MNTNPKDEVAILIDDDILLDDYRVSDYNVSESYYIETPILEDEEYKLGGCEMETFTFNTELSMKGSLGGKVLVGRSSESGNPMMAIVNKNRQNTDGVPEVVTTFNGLWKNDGEESRFVLNHQPVGDKFKYDGTALLNPIPSFIIRNAYGNKVFEPLMHVEIDEKKKEEFFRRKPILMAGLLDFAVEFVQDAIRVGWNNSKNMDDYTEAWDDTGFLRVFINNRHCKGTDAIPVTKLVKPLIAGLMWLTVDYDWNRLPQGYKDYLNYDSDGIGESVDTQTLDSYSGNNFESTLAEVEVESLKDSIKEVPKERDDSFSKSYEEFSKKLLS